MQIRPLLEKWIVISLASVVFPPLGLVLVWIRRHTRLMRKLVCSLVILVFGFFYLRFLFGLRIETDGTGISPLISFYKRERHYARLEENRAHQKQEAACACPRGGGSTTPSGFISTFHSRKFTVTSLAGGTSRVREKGRITEKHAKLLD